MLRLASKIAGLDGEIPDFLSGSFGCAAAWPAPALPFTGDISQWSNGAANSPKMQPSIYPIVLEGTYEDGTLANFVLPDSRPIFWDRPIRTLGLKPYKNWGRDLGVSNALCPWTLIAGELGNVIDGAVLAQARTTNTLAFRAAVDANAPVIGDTGIFSFVGATLALSNSFINPLGDGAGGSVTNKTMFGVMPTYRSMTFGFTGGDATTVVSLWYCHPGASFQYTPTGPITPQKWFVSEVFNGTDADFNYAKFRQFFEPLSAFAFSVAGTAPTVDIFVTESNGG